VLIVDDNVQLLTFMAMVLEAPDREVLRAETREQAIEISRHSKIDVALVDYLLPDLDGVKLCSLLKVERSMLQAIIMTPIGPSPHATGGDARGHFSFTRKAAKVFALPTRLLIS